MNKQNKWNDYLKTKRISFQLLVIIWPPLHPVSTCAWWKLVLEDGTGQTGEGDITKSIMMLIGACLFMIGAYVLFPAFFGYNII